MEKSYPMMNGVVQPLLTDLYQITMAYAYWKNNKCSDHAVFDLFFRKNPFHGEFTVFAGLEECLKFLENFRYSESDINYLKNILPSNVEPAFFEFLENLTAREVKLYAIPEGTVVFPRVPLIRVEGPLLVVQLLETSFLTLVNYASLVATNAARYRIVAGSDLQLLEYGLRRAQGPDGGLSASKYVYIGGFDGTSNVLAGKLYNIPVKGTHAHAFVMSYSSLEEISETVIKSKNQETDGDLLKLSLQYRSEVSTLLHLLKEEANEGELTAFIAYAVAFPNCFLALIDTYDVKKSGLLNFCAVALGLCHLGYKPLGVRIDSGDLAYLSNVAFQIFCRISDHFNIPWFRDLSIVASNDINEETIISLNEQGHKINCFGIGTHLVTCQKQPALGCVFKLVEVKSKPCIKLSLDVEKVTIPGGKAVYRLFGKDGHALIDLLQTKEEPPPEVGKKVLVRHPFQESKRAYVQPVQVQDLQTLYFSDGKICTTLPTLSEIRQHVKRSLATLRSDIKRNLNPTPYKVSVSDQLYQFMHNLWLENAPIGELF
ncbi:nicotinate phosphoribosyltransferase [Trichonephila inaurata madagascariensis]|uniref:Nicotinate phosphoribosyltransferase n=1 Tax=Trichonephila inaurata madagascariensis TaxID=2747483 RepID=A0A8X6K4T5_9ARAC|nr:nicotinate phosphoribosyltransferase [Trichonephila inaurata madagascariensis]